MAKTNFKIFAEAAKDILTDAEYESNTQRTSGVEPGLAKADLHNKLYKQATIMVAAMAQVLVERGFDAMDNDYNGLVAGLKQALVFSVNGIKANANGNVDYRLLSFDDIYPVGAIYTSTNNINPGTIFGGEWRALAPCRCLIGAGDGFTAGATGGEKEHTLTKEEMPVHEHNVSVTAANGHKHNRGTMEITGAVKLWKHYAAEGAFQINGTWGGAQTKNGGGDPTARAEFKASRTWTGETSEAGAHSHTAVANSVGDNKPHNNMQPYLVVYFWERVK